MTMKIKNLRDSRENSASDENHNASTRQIFQSRALMNSDRKTRRRDARAGMQRCALHRRMTVCSRVRIESQPCVHEGARETLWTSQTRSVDLTPRKKSSKKLDANGKSLVQVN
jgi:hypothetical protein